MDIDTLSQLISSFGFPIVACGALFWYMNKTNSENHEEVNALKDAVNKLEIAIVKLCDKLDVNVKSD